MRCKLRMLAGLFAGVLWISSQAVAQTPATPVASTTQGAIAATVNGQVLSELAVQRALKTIPPAKHAEARPEVVDFLINNMLIEQYLVAQKIAVDPKEVQAKLAKAQEEVKAQNKDFVATLKEFNLTEEEFKAELTAQLRWDKFAQSRSAEPALKTFFEQNKEMFDGTMVQARHILLSPKAGDAKAVEAAKAQLLAIKNQVIAAGNDAVGKVPATADANTKEQAKAAGIEDAFARAAETNSVCPSNKQGGNLSWFPRVGSGRMDENFAKVAFALKPFTVSDPVSTQFGLHLILVTGRKDGQLPQFEQVKDVVQEVVQERLLESLTRQLRQTAKIAITPPAKTKT
ncbi:MAG: peptidylprolyl isomerase [Gemmataceae bacterium]